MKKIANDEKGYDKELDANLTSILESLEIDSSTKSVVYKQLRRHLRVYICFVMTGQEV